MAREFEHCLQSTYIPKPANLFAWIRRLGTQPDLNRIIHDVPELDTVNQKNEFCDVYDEVVTHYWALCTVGSEADKSQL